MSEAKKLKMATALEQMKLYSTVVADTGDFEGKFAIKFAGAVGGISLPARGYKSGYVPFIVYILFYSRQFWIDCYTERSILVFNFRVYGTTHFNFDGMA